jgi:hypothetical protein
MSTPPLAALVPQTNTAVAAPWELARKIIEHEDNLINHRLTWLITIQGFLFAAFAVVANDLLESTHGKTMLLRVMMYATTFLGVMSAYIVWNSIRTAFAYTQTITAWWNENFAAHLAIQGIPYPPLRGTRANMGAIRKFLHTHNIPMIMIYIWVVLLVAGLIW